MIIYLATNLVNNKIYIGQTVRSVTERFKDHKKSKTLFGKALKKYGFENFKIDIIDNAVSMDELNVKEIKWISFYNSMHPNGYNLCEGGGNTKGYHHREDTKEIMRVKKEGMYFGEENPFYNKTHSIETRKKFSEQRTGRLLSKEWKKSLAEASPFKKEVINVDTKEIFGSCQEAATKYGVASNKISYSCTGRQKTSCGYRWMFLKDYNSQKEHLNLKPLDEFLNELKENQCKSAGQNKRKVINLQTLDVFDSLTIEAQTYGLKSSASLCSACKDQTKKSCGFNWMYYDEYMTIPCQALTK